MKEMLECTQAQTAVLMLIILVLLALPKLAFATGHAANVVVSRISVAEVGMRVIAQCTYVTRDTTVVGFEWLLNGTSLSSLQLTDDVVVSFDDIGSTGALTFRNVAYNGTFVQCFANTTSGLVARSNITTYFQGLLDAVGSLTVEGNANNTILLSWTAPFTLDIRFIKHDISGYCVDVVSSTSSATLHSECGITETEFTYPLPPRSWCDEYNFTVTPVNVVGNGTMNSVQYSQDLPDPEVTSLVRNAISYTVLMSSLLCTAQLVYIGTFTEESIMLDDRNVTIDKTNITFSAQQLTENRHYNLTITASNIAGSATSLLEISTHDVIDAMTVLEGGGVRIFATFTENSVATGAFMCFVYAEAENGTKSSFDRSYCMAWQKSEIVSPGRVFPLALWPGEYRVYTYDIESNMRLQDGVGYPADLHTVVVSGAEPNNTKKGNCNLSSGDREITVVCPFSQFQVAALGNDTDSRGIVYVDTSMDSLTEATLQVPENGEYLVTVLPMGGILSGRIFSQAQIVGNSDNEGQVTSKITLSTYSSSTTDLAPTGFIVGSAVAVIFSATP